MFAKATIFNFTSFNISPRAKAMNLQTEPIEEYKAPAEETAWSRVKKALAPLGVVGVLIAKFFAKLKFILLPLFVTWPVSATRAPGARGKFLRPATATL